MRILQTIDIPNDPELDLVSMYAQVHTIKRLLTTVYGSERGYSRNRLNEKTPKTE